MSLTVESTPTRNQHSVIFKLNKTLIPPGTGLSFVSKEQAAENPLAQALLEIPGVASVWIIGDEVQVTKDDSIRWGAIHSRVIQTIREQES